MNSFNAQVFFFKSFHVTFHPTLLQGSCRSLNFLKVLDLEMLFQMTFQIPALFKELNSLLVLQNFTTTRKSGNILSTYLKAVFVRHSSAGPPREFRGPGAKEKKRSPLRAKQAENFQGLQVNFGKLLLVYFLRPLGP